MKLSVVYKLGLLIIAVLGATFFIVLKIFEQGQFKDLTTLMLKQAQTLKQQIVLTRKWAASHGGVYVPKRPGVETNPFLYQVGPGRVRPEITDREGIVYTLKNPALITRELSEITNQAGLVRYRLTSLNPINPINAPDPFEAESLKKFSNGTTETTDVIQEQGKTFFRYMAPLYVEETCLKCHGFQSYRAGDVRGAISLFLPMDTEMDLILVKGHTVLIGGAALLIIIMVALIMGSRMLILHPVSLLSGFAAGKMGGRESVSPVLLQRRDEVGDLARSLQASSKEIGEYRQGLEQKVAERTDELRRAKEQLDLLSRTDPLTGLYNRRHLLLEAPALLALSGREKAGTVVLMLDIDHFKNLNDTYGHEAGDRALVHVSQILDQLKRPYDLLVRFGGEEFVLILPLTSAEHGMLIAERIRTAIEMARVHLEGKDVGMTVSIGMYATTDIGNVEAAIRRADEALYKAKNSGRNQTHMAGDTAG